MTDADLERAIDLAGRDRVFARARRYGWTSNDIPPRYVWTGIVAELRRDDERNRMARHDGR